MARGAASGRRGLVIGAAFVGAVAVGLIAALALTSGDSPPPAATAAASSSTPSVSSPAPESVATTSSPSESPSPSHSRSATLPSAPAKTSGGLTARALPQAKSLGSGWVFRVDNGSAEGGYVGNGTPTVARSPAEVVMTVVPLGCEKRSDLPTPLNVLETDYRHKPSGTAGVALRLRFASAAAAGRFTEARRADLVACAAQPLQAADEGQHVVTGLHATGNGTYVSVRTDVTLPKSERSWTEVAAYLGGRDVLLLAVNKAGTPQDVVRLSTAARSVL